MRSLLLASRSPNRRQLLEDAGFVFRVQPADVDETLFPGEEPAEHVRRLARLKAHAVAAPAGMLVIGCDTVVTVDGEIFGKPRDAEQAREMLQRLSGRWHEVWSGLAVRDPDAERTRAESCMTPVRFIPLTPAMIEWYVATGEPLGRAGAYALQGRGMRLIAEVRGCFTNVVGLSIPLLDRMLAECAAR